MNAADCFFLVIVLASNIVQGVTGFAGTMLAMPPSMLLIGTIPAKAALNLFGLLASAVIAVKEWRHINLRVFLRIAVVMGAGMACAPLLERAAPERLLTGLYGAFLLVFAAVRLLSFRKKSQRKTPLPEWLGVVVLLCAGVIHGLYVSGGALLVVYAAARLDDKAAFRATLAPVWVVLNGIMLARHAAVGAFDRHTLLLCAAGVIPLVLGLLIGNAIHARVSRGAFLVFSYILLAVNGALLVLSAM